MIILLYMFSHASFSEVEGYLHGISHSKYICVHYLMHTDQTVLSLQNY